MERGGTCREAVRLSGHGLARVGRLVIIMVYLVVVVVILCLGAIAAKRAQDRTQA